MSVSEADIVGWAATAVFTVSYFFPKPSALRLTQMLGAALWLLFGLLIASKPVIVCNALVLAAAAWTLVRGRGVIRADS